MSIFEFSSMSQKLLASAGIKWEGKLWQWFLSRTSLRSVILVCCTDFGRNLFQSSCLHSIHLIASFQNCQPIYPSLTISNNLHLHNVKILNHAWQLIDYFHHYNIIHHSNHKIQENLGLCSQISATKFIKTHY